MSNLRAVAAQLKPLFENPEIGAMAEICEILQALPDDAARLRVMRWSFARFGGEEFKRSVPAITPPSAPASPTQYDAVEVDDDPLMVPTEVVPQREAEQDLADQVSELKDLFPRKRALPNKLRQV
jgi:hypothetical protein